MKTFEYHNSCLNIFSLSIGKKYLYEIADTLLHDFDEEAIIECHREINDFIYSVNDKKLLSQFVVPYEISKCLDDTSIVNSLAKGLDREITVANDWGQYYDFYSSLLNYMKQAKDWFENDRVNGKMHLCFSYKPKQPSEYAHLEDTKVGYNSILAKFYLIPYAKYTNHTKEHNEGCAYFVAFTFLFFISNLYKILKPYIVKVKKFLWLCLATLNPVVVGLTMTCQYNLGKTSAISVLYELLQLSSKTPNLHISKNSTQYSMTFTYTTLTSPFGNNGSNDFVRDNNGDRNVKMHVSGTSNILTLRFDFIGLAILNDILGKAVDKDLYSLPVNELLKMQIAGKALVYMLNSTNFKTKKITTDFLSVQAKVLLDKFKLKRYGIDYIIIATMLAKLDSKTINKKLKCIADKQKADIRKMIKAVQETQIEPSSCLKAIYDKYRVGI
ncbi:TPA: hypothetical protein CPT88_08760 [Candidatus Gastranaerophilales bacterium HUM_8]|nr:MAG TPA: hypothetical protein CPT88_08760 [Candidatus Gastranaerophilales bacterium HUM_8]DAA99041.1 MAG TPA: hypothetical protein CPT89_11185 [Candidatus Gastranaerophilales bacterium HUM_11]